MPRKSTIPSSCARALWSVLAVGTVLAAQACHGPCQAGKVPQGLFPVSPDEPYAIPEEYTASSELAIPYLQGLIYGIDTAFKWEAERETCDPSSTEGPGARAFDAGLERGKAYAERRLQDVKRANEERERLLPGSRPH
jgi:hypothetical protein